MGRRSSRSAAVLCFMLSVGFTMAHPANAQSTDNVAVLAGSCANCHGTDGRSQGVIVSIAGRPESALREQLIAFKSTSPPPGTTIMDRIAKGYSDAELAALAKYFAAIPAQAPATAKGKKSR